jgi:PHP family Zn ribbon phosphoesterase
METYEIRIDWHVHTTLSPCGSLQMDPQTIIRKAKETQMDVIGITDHNSTRQAKLMKQEFPESDLLILTGAEVTTSEEIHCLAFFEKPDVLDEFQDYLDEHLPDSKNNPRLFGDQVVVDRSGRIVFDEVRLLLSGLDQTIDQVAEFVRRRGGIFIPAHINRPGFGLIAQLGLVPEGLPADAMEWVPGIPGIPTDDFTGIGRYPLVQGSDAHVPEVIGTRFTVLTVAEKSFNGIREALLASSKRLL